MPETDFDGIMMSEFQLGQRRGKSGRRLKEQMIFCTLSNVACGPKAVECVFSSPDTVSQRQTGKQVLIFKTLPTRSGYPVTRG